MPSKTFKDYTKEELSAFGKKGAPLAAQKKKDKKSFRLALEYILNLPSFRLNPDYDTLIRMLPEGMPLTNYDEMALAQVVKAMRDGDTKAFLAVRDTVGEQPSQSLNLANNDMKITISVLGDDSDEDSPAEAE